MILIKDDNDELRAKLQKQQEQELKRQSEQNQLIQMIGEEIRCPVSSM